MNRFMRHSYLWLLFLAAALILPATQASGQPHPLEGRPILSESKEMVTLVPLTTSGDCQTSIDDVLYSATWSLAPGSQVTRSDAVDDPEQLQLDLAHGDFDGDGDDDIVLAYQMSAEDYVKLLIPDIAHGALSWSQPLASVDFWFNETVDSCHDQPGVRVRSGNFDSDEQDEILFVVYNRKDLIQLCIYELVGSSLVQAASIEHELLDPRLDESARFDVTVGDFDGNGRDEVLLVAAEYATDTEWRLYARAYDCDIERPVFADRIEPAGRSGTLLSWNPQEYTNFSWGQGVHYDHLAVEAADLDGDGLDEVVLGYQKQIGRWYATQVCQLIPLLYWHDFWTYTSVYLQILSVSADLGTITPQLPTAHVHRSGETFHGARCGGGDDWHVTGSALGIAAGDLDGDEAEEFVVMGFGKLAAYSMNESFEIEEGASQLLPITYRDPSRRVVEIVDLVSDPGDDIWEPEVVVSYWNGTRYVRILDNELSGGGTDLTDSIPYQEHEPIATIFADVDGDRVRVGTPTCTPVTFAQPLVVLNAPPTHYDVLGGVPYDIAGCHDDPGPGGCGFYSVYVSEQSSTITHETTVHSDWGVGASVSAGVEGIVNVSLEARYGENFSDVWTNIYSQTFTHEATADIVDQLQVIETTYDFWEYPLRMGSEPAGYLLIAQYLSAEERWPDWDQWAGRTDLPTHECENVLSYGPEGARFGDEIEYLIAVDSYDVKAAGSYGFEFTSNDFSASGASMSNDIEMEVGASVQGWGIEVGVTGSYGRGQITTNETTVTSAITVTYDFGSVTQEDALYTIKPYLYWAMNGALVLDYETIPMLTSGTIGVDSWWEEHYGYEPDLAFICPWRYASTVSPSKSTLPPDFSHDIVITPSHAQAGDTVTVSARVHNYSLVDLEGPHLVRFFRGEAADKGVPIGEAFLPVDGIPARGSATAEIEWVIPEYVWGGVHRIYAYADPENEVVEVHEDNNLGYAILNYDGSPTAAEPVETPRARGLRQNYPNPFNPRTTIHFDLASAGPVLLQVFDVKGRLLATLQDGELEAGPHVCEWDGRDHQGRAVASGIYLYRLEQGGDVQVRKMALLR